MTLLQNCEESIICQFETCKSVYDTPVFLICCGESICEKHVDKLSIPGDRTRLKCCFCNQEFIKPGEGLKLNKGIQKLINTDLTEDQVLAKISLNRLNEKLNKYDHLRSEPDFYIHEYFNNIRQQIEDKREENKKSFDEHFDEMLNKIDQYEVECKTNKFDLDCLKTNDFELLESELEGRKEEVKKFMIDDSKWKKINSDILSDTYEVDKKIREIQSKVLNKKSYEYKKPSGNCNIEEVLGSLEVIEDSNVSNCNLITGSFDKSIKLWNIDQGKCLKTFSEHNGEILALKLISKTVLVSSSADKTIKIWDVPSVKCKRTINHDNLVTYCLVRYKDDEFFSGQQDGMIRLWNISQMNPKKEFSGHKNSIRGLEIIQSKNQLISCSCYETIKIWNIDTTECVQTIKSQINRVFDMKLSPNNKDIFVGTKQGYVRKVELNYSTRWELTAHESVIFAIELLPGNRIATGSGDKSIKIWDLNTGNCLKTLQGHENFVLCLKLIPDGRLISSSCDKTIKIWDLKAFECIKTLYSCHNDSIRCLELIECY